MAIAQTLYTVIFLTYFVALLPSLLVGFFLSKRLQRQKEGVKSYVWGYTNGIASIFSCIFAVIYFVLLEPDEYATETGGAVKYAVLAGILLIVYYGFFARSRIWIVFAVLMQLNVLFWIINWSYLKNRWHEFDGKDGTLQSIENPQNPQNPQNHENSDAQVGMRFDDYLNLFKVGSIISMWIAGILTTIILLFLMFTNLDFDELASSRFVTTLLEAFMGAAIENLALLFVVAVIVFCVSFIPSLPFAYRIVKRDSTCVSCGKPFQLRSSGIESKSRWVEYVYEEREGVRQNVPYNMHAYIQYYQCDACGHESSEYMIDRDRA